jgi:hypothetical protein
MPRLRHTLVGSLLLATAVAATFVGCRGDFQGVTPGKPSDDEEDLSGAGGSDGAGGSGSTGAGNPECPELGVGRPPLCDGPEATIAQLTTNEIGLDQQVTLKDVVVMSQKFLVSASRNTGNCLWGVYVSTQVAETAADTGMLVLGYGRQASIPEGGTEAECPKLGVEPACDWIPDDVKPGDVLTVVGTSAIFPAAPDCDDPDPDNQVGMRQLANTCYVERTGTAPVPTPHVLTPDEIAKITSTTDKDFHSSWGAVKVRLENVGVDPDANEVVGARGVITLDNGIPISSKLYYRPYSDNPCHASAVFSNTAIQWNRIDAFHYLNFCTWGLDVNDKCADFDPPSEDCLGGFCEFD